MTGSTREQQQRMLRFFVSELETRDWMLALSADDADSLTTVLPTFQTYRADHQSTGSYDGWPGLAASVRLAFGDEQATLDWLRRISAVTREGPSGRRTGSAPTPSVPHTERPRPASSTATATWKPAAARWPPSCCRTWPGPSRWSMTMGAALWRLSSPQGIRWAIGSIPQGPSRLLEPGLSLDTLLGRDGPGLGALDQLPTTGPVPPASRVLVPAGSQPVWAAGVTYERSRAARRAESSSPDHYDHVYQAERPELFLKALPGAARGPRDPVAVRGDSTWDVPEPELALAIDADGQVAGYTIGNDMSSRSIEGENPLYLPQASCTAEPAHWDPPSCPAGTPQTPPTWSSR